MIQKMFIDQNTLALDLLHHAQSIDAEIRHTNGKFYLYTRNHVSIELVLVLNHSLQEKDYDYLNSIKEWE